MILCCTSAGQGASPSVPPLHSPAHRPWPNAEWGYYTEWTAAAAGAKRGVDQVIIGGNSARPRCQFLLEPRRQLCPTMAVNISPRDLPSQVVVLQGVDAPDSVSLSQGLMRFRVNLEGVCGVDDLIGVVAAELLFPHDASGLDALLDLMSDLDWFGHDAGYVVEFAGLDQLQRRDPELLEQFLDLLPNLCDRWGSSGVSFRIVLRCKRSTRGVIRDAIDAANARIEKAAKQPWLADLTPVEVIECVDWVDDLHELEQDGA